MPIKGEDIGLSFSKTNPGKFKGGCGLAMSPMISLVNLEMSNSSSSSLDST